MGKLSGTFRLLYIYWVFLKHGLDEVILSAHWFRFIRFLQFFSPFYWFNIGNKRPYGYRLRRALEDLGPIYVKFGQILSTRRDILSPEIAQELVKLQDQVPPFSSEQASKIIEKSLGKSLEEAFATFEMKPLASASIAQVHTATLHNGKKVVVKVLRPHIKKTIRRDLRLMYFLARMVQGICDDGRRLKPVEVIQEYEKTIYDELDLAKEAANASQLRRNFENDETLYVPEVYWDYCKQDIMVMERIYGCAVDDIDTLTAQGVSLKMLAERGVEIFFTQVFKHNFFHADMHPGNIFVKPDGQYISIDFGIMGSLTKDDQRYLAENLLAFFNRDYHRVAQLHVDSEWVPAETNVQEFEAAIRTVCEPIFNRPLSEISFGLFLLNLFKTAKRFKMEVQPQLVLLQKTLLNIEGIGRQLYPQLDLWVTAKPFMEKWLKAQIGPKAFFIKIKDSLPELSEQLPEMPQLMYRAINHLADGALNNNHTKDEIKVLRQQLQFQHQQLTAILGGITFIASGLSLGFLSPDYKNYGLFMVVVGSGLILLNLKRV